MRTITHYLLLTRDRADELDKLVNKFIEEGWQPHGGVSVTFYERGSGYAQAMVKTEWSSSECNV